MGRIFILLFFSLTTSVLPAQKLTYEVYLFGKNIGTVRVERVKDRDGKVTYLLQSATVAHVFFTTRKSYQNYIVNYADGKLMKVDAVNSVNDETVKVSLLWDVSHYVVKRNDRYSYFREAIPISTLCLYFQEPVMGVKIFSERLAEYFEAKKTEASVFEYTLSDGIRNIFHYQNGIPFLIQMKKSFVTVEMRLVKQEN